jgi:hypothetical protein
MEVFVFLQMGGERESMVIKPLDETAGLAFNLAHFDAAKAQCFLPSDRQKLFGIIESAFGTFAPFNKTVRGIFREAERESQQSRANSRLTHTLTAADKHTVQLVTV